MRPTHHFGVIFGDLAKKNVVNVSRESAYKYWLWNDLEAGEFEPENIKNPLMNYVVIKYKKWWIGVGKLLDGRIKNKYLK